ncbi:MAG: glycosyltransferase domain-containing protein [Methyloligellaceae bacterium]
MSNDYRRTCILVLGMHRSGTSVLTRLINLMGAEAPENLMAPGADNIKGYWESSHIMHLNQQVLSELGSNWDDWLPLNFEKLPLARKTHWLNKFVELIHSEFKSADTFVLKDPRLCRMVPFLLEALKKENINTKVVIAFRNPLEVAASLKKRNNFSQQKSLLLWLSHTLEAVVSTKNLPQAFIGYEDLLTNYQGVVKAINKHLQLPQITDDKINQEITSFITPELRHHTRNQQDLENNHLLSRVREVYKTLEKLANNQDKQKNIEKVHQHYYEFTQGTLHLLSLGKKNRSGWKRNISRVYNIGIDSTKIIRSFIFHKKTTMTADAYRKTLNSFITNHKYRKYLTSIALLKFSPILPKTTVNKLTKRKTKNSYEAYLITLCQQALNNKASKNDALLACNTFLSIEPDNISIKVAHILLMGRLTKIDDIKTQWEELWKKTTLSSPNLHPLHNELCKRLNKSNDSQFDIIKKAPINKEKPFQKVCVYTTLFGAYDDLSPISEQYDNIDFICFTDQDIAPNGWKVVACSPKLGNSNLDAKYYKIHPHIHLKNYSYSLFIDANTHFAGDISDLIYNWLINQPYVMWKHPGRSCIYDEAEAILAQFKHEPTKIIKQIARYDAEGMPKHTGLLEASFIWREHTNKEISSFMEDWWNEITSNSNRDQLSLAYLMWKTGVKPKTFPSQVGDSRKNNWFYKKTHLSPQKSSREIKREFTSRSIYTKKDPDIVFLYSEKHSQAGSTIMRGKQLSKIIRKHADTSNKVLYTSNKLIANSVVILTKGLLKEITLEELYAIKKNNICLVADYVDDKFEVSSSDYIDIYMTASLKALNAIKKKYGTASCWYVTHHIDPRIRNFIPPSDISRIGYFGELVNTIQTADLEKYVNYIPVNTKNSENIAWIEELENYNTHFGIRNTRGIDGFKPFLKGFTAAHCSSNIIVPIDESDARHYLGVDYPYILKDHKLDTVMEMIAFVRESFGGKEWQYGLEIMKDLKRRSSNEIVTQEFHKMIKFITT